MGIEELLGQEKRQGAGCWVFGIQFGGEWTSGVSYSACDGVVFETNLVILGKLLSHCGQWWV